jgi:histidine ammonia-lyase/tyrosine ammonia-lyase
MIIINGHDLTIEALYDVAVRGAQVAVAPEATARIQLAHDRVQTWGRNGTPVYGINTGFGQQIHVLIAAAEGFRLQRNLLFSHAAGSGPAFPAPETRAIILARLNCLVRGRSGVSLRATDLLTTYLNRSLCPYIPQQGSLGASGDLAPLCHLALTLIGQGCFVSGTGTERARDALARAGLSPIELGFKEGLALEPIRKPV